VQQVNLYQPILRREQRLFSARAMAGALGVLVAALVTFAAFAASRALRIEREVAVVSREQEASQRRLDLSAGALEHGRGLADRAAAEQRLAAEIAARERALAALGSGGAVAGFAARLEALAHAHIEGLWLRRIVLTNADGRFSLLGATVDPRHVPQFLAALRGEPALGDLRFQSFEIRQAGAEERPAVALFRGAGPGTRLDPWPDDPGQRP
jgi:hypothetical protein